ncbi:MAG TPA: DEAD/DEAH box helicase [Motilibacterales bacterium]|nr:DEAD/DEAH box helicase [Motilibacterales bacterium]
MGTSGVGRGGGPVSVPELADRLAGDPRSVGRIPLPARVGRTAGWPAWLDPDVRQAYQQAGIVEPWLHQVLTADLAWSGQHVLVATGTASGKSAAFGMPALTAALAEPEGPGRRGPGVLYLSPTKALAHDQLAGLVALGLVGLRAAAVDGDTPDEERAWARTHARWIVTNPDMLHRGILPRHDAWRAFLRSLRYVIVDEAHTYRGVFGSHVALVLRRLRRVAALHGATPTFIAASATIADAGPTAARLLGVEAAVVDADHSARGAVDIVLWNPQGRVEGGGPGGPSHGPGGSPGDRPGDLPGDPDQPIPGFRGTLTEAADLMAQLVDQGISTLTFARSRRAVEVLAASVRDRAANGARVRAYRGGYLPEERRALEADLRSGRLLGLAATNALELGIDISGLDAVLLVGWPGTRSSFWQQVGRAGRRGGSALAVLIAREDPLDQYIVSHPETLTGRPVEATVMDPENPYVLAGHLCAAAAETPLVDHDLETMFGPGARNLCEVLADRGLLRRRRDGWYWTDSSRAVDLVDLRGTSGGPVRVVEEGTGRLLGTVDPATAPSAVHDGALYVHQGSVFEVLALDLDARVATATPTVTDLSTHARSTADVTFETVRDTTHWGRVDVSCGEVVVTRQVTSYLVRRWPSGQVLAQHPLDLPPMALQTVAMWWSIPDKVLAAARIEEAEVPGAVHALEHASIGILPLLATCDRWDLGGVSTARHPQTGQAVIVVHDGYPGGAGFAERGYQQSFEWLTATREAIGACPCPTGCPACVQSPKCGNGNEPLDKAAALRLADALLAEHAARS